MTVTANAQNTLQHFRGRGGASAPHGEGASAPLPMPAGDHENAAHGSLKIWV